MDIYIVKEDETINDILDKFKLSYEDIENYNNLDLSNLKEGDIINIPLTNNYNFTYYEVNNKDTLSKIASNYNIDVLTLAYLNGIDINDYIYPGQMILVPKSNVSVYITDKGDTLKLLQDRLGDIEDIIRDNDEIYLKENQLIIKKDIH